MFCSPFLAWLIHNNVPMQIITVEVWTTWVLMVGTWCVAHRKFVCGEILWVLECWH